MSIHHINIPTLHEIWSRDQTRIIDVREIKEYQEGHVPGARNLPLATILQHADTLPEERIYLICRSGMRSAKAAEALAKHGLTAELFTVDGGTLGWIEAGFATNRGEAA